MPNLAAALKDEIRRLARKEVKTQTATTVRAVANYRREIARLKRQLREQEKAIKSVVTKTHVHSEAPNEDSGLNGGERFSARSARAQRRRTGLSAADYARLVGVAPLTIYNWENGKSRPRQEQFAALVALRGLGKREAQAKLELLAAPAKRSPPTRTRRTRRAPK